MVKRKSLDEVLALAGSGRSIIPEGMAGIIERFLETPLNAFRDNLHKINLYNLFMGEEEQPDYTYREYLDWYMHRVGDSKIQYCPPLAEMSYMSYFGRKSGKITIADAREPWLCSYLNDCFVDDEGNSIADVLFCSRDVIDCLGDVEHEVTVIKETGLCNADRSGDIEKPFQRKNINGGYWPPEDDEGELAATRVWLIMVKGLMDMEKAGKK